MFENRVREFFAEQAAVATAAVPVPVGFVACPVCAFGLSQQAFVTEVYRLAREMTEAQLRKPKRSRIPTFSMN